jgi:hypothetical protein
MYLEKHDEAQAYVAVYDLKRFVKNTYDPKCMFFTGVVIDACSSQDAISAYEAPNDYPETTIAWIPEPPETANYAATSTTQEQLELAAHMLHCSTLAVKIAKSLQECNEQLAELAHFIRVFSMKSPDADKEVVFRRLKDRYIEHFKRLHYKPFTPDET